MRFLRYVVAAVGLMNALILFNIFKRYFLLSCEQCRMHTFLDSSFALKSRNTTGNVSEIASLISKSVTVFVAILTHPKRKPRRDAIRDTWMSSCNDKPSEINCKFFTDGVGLENHTELELKKEQAKNKDLIFVLIPGESSSIWLFSITKLKRI